MYFVQLTLYREWNLSVDEFLKEEANRSNFMSDYSDLDRCLHFLCRGQRVRIVSFTSQKLVFRVEMATKNLIKKFKKKLSFRNLSGLVDKLMVQVQETTGNGNGNGYEELSLSDVDEFIGKFALFFFCNVYY